MKQEKKQFACQHCKRSFSLRGPRTTHQRNCPANPDNEGKDQCPKCQEYSTTHKGHLQRHIRMCSGSTRCIHCSRNFEDLRRTRIHEGQCPRNPDGGQRGVRDENLLTFQCLDCTARFKTAYEFKRHEGKCDTVITEGTQRGSRIQTHRKRRSSPWRTTSQ